MTTMNIKKTRKVIGSEKGGGGGRENIFEIRNRQQIKGF